MKILVTGFEPFGGETENASGIAVQRLGDGEPGQRQPHDDQHEQLRTRRRPSTPFTSP